MYKRLLADFSSGINLACAPLQLGLDATKTQWSSGLNVEIFSQKGVCRQNGNTLLTKNPDNKAITSVFTFTPHDSTISQRVLYSTSDGCFYEYNTVSSTHACLKSGLTADKPCIYTEFLDGVAVSNGADEPFFYKIVSGVGTIKETNTVAKDGESKIIADAMCAYKSRLWLASGDTIYYSALGTYDDWQTVYDAGYISNFHCNSAKITALMPYKDYIAVYKADETFLLSGFSPEDFSILPFANKGAAGPNAVVTANNRQFFFSGGLFCLEQTGLLAQITLGSEASLNIKPVLNGTAAILKTFTDSSNNNYKAGGNLDRSKLYKLHAVPYERKNQIWFYIPTQNNQYINNIWIFDWINNAWTFRALPQPVLCAANKGDDIICGTADGRILIEDLGPTFDSEPIQFEWKSPFLTLGNPNSYKIIDDFHLLISDTHDNNFIFSTFRDYDTLEAQDRENIVVSNSQNLLWGSETLDDGAFVWADETEPLENAQLWAIPCETSQKTEVSGSCLAVQFCIEGYLPEHNFALLALQYKEITPD